MNIRYQHELRREPRWITVVNRPLLVDLRSAAKRRHDEDETSAMQIGRFFARAQWQA